MEPIHALEYELTSELASDIQRTLMRFGLAHGWKRDLPVILGWLAFAGLLAWPVFAGWWSAGLAGAVLFVATLIVLGKLYSRHLSPVAGVASALVALHGSDRRVRLEFHETRVSMETEFFRGEAAWRELEELLVFPSFWSLRFSNSGHIVIPAALVTPELGAFLHAKVEQALADERPA